MDIDPEPEEEQVIPEGAIVRADRQETADYLEPGAWSQFFGGSQPPQFPGATFAAFSVTWDEAGCLNIKIVLEGPDGMRETVEVGPLPVASLMYVASWSMMAAYGQWLGYSPFPYAVNSQNAAIEEDPSPPLLPGVS